MWREEGTAFDPKHTTSSVKHGGGSVMDWADMAASGTGSIIFIDDLTNDGRSRMNSSEVYRNIFFLPRYKKMPPSSLHSTSLAARQ